MTTFLLIVTSSESAHKATVYELLSLCFSIHQLPDVTEELNNVQNSNLGAQTLLDDISNVSITCRMTYDI